MKRKFWDSIAKDLWIVLLDILAVNIAYYLAIQVRFYVNITEETIFTDYAPYWVQFVPYYTVACLLVFLAFRLYGGMWRYAGVNDMNRIIGANAVTIVIQVIGTTLVFYPPDGHRMPIKYYIIGAILQFFFITLIRFGYRMLLVERKKAAARKTSAIPALIIGAGETGRRAVVHLEEGGEYRPVAVINKEYAGKFLNGIPVVGNLESVLQDAKAVFIADSTLTQEERKAIKQKTDEKGIELQDYTGYFSNLSGKVPISTLLELAAGPVTISIEGQEKTYGSGEAALQDLSGKYEVAKVENLKLELRKASNVPYVGYEAWAAQHKEQTGEEVSFF